MSVSWMPALFRGTLKEAPEKQQLGMFRGFVKEPSWEGEKDNPRGVTSVSRERVLSNVSHTVKPATETTD